MFAKKMLRLFRILILTFILRACKVVSDEWKCDDGEPIQLSWKCDRSVDCLDGSDESLKNCPDMQCIESDFKCDNGRCISYGLVCNGEADCGDEDFSDELPHNCIDGTPDEEPCNLTTSRPCPDIALCLPLEWWCDGENDCPDNSDEIGCSACLPGQIKCNNTGDECTDPKWICDGEFDCSDGEDESNCPVKTSTFTVPPPKCNIHEFSCGSRCFPVSKACDGNADCPNGEDEGVSCHSKNQCRLRGSPKMWHQHDGLCDQACKPTPEGPKCYCYPGYRLELDGLHCRPEVSFKPTLYYAADNQIRNLVMDASKPSIEIATTDHKHLNAEILGLAYDYSTNSLLWTDHKSGTVNMLDDNGYHRTLVDKIDEPSGLSFDWLTNNVYITFKPRVDVYGKVGVFNLVRQQGHFVKPDLHILNSMKLKNPVSIAVFPQKGQMLVLDSKTKSSPSRLLLAGMDGSGVKNLLTDTQSLFHCVTIDYLTGIAYWTRSNSEASSIEMIHILSLTHKTLISTNAKEFPFIKPFSVSVFLNDLYFSDPEAREIWRINSITGKPVHFGGNHHSPLVKSARVSRLLALTVAHPISQVRSGTDSCSAARCSHFCLLRPLGSTCICPHSMELSLDGKTCVEIKLETVTKPPISTSTTTASSTTTSTTARTTTTPPPTTTTSTETTVTTMPAYTTTTLKPKNTCFPPPFVYKSISSPRYLSSRFYLEGYKIHYTCLGGSHVKGSNLKTDNITCTGGDWDKRIVCVDYTCSDLQCGNGGKCIYISTRGAICECKSGQLKTSKCPLVTSTISNTTTQPTSVNKLIQKTPNGGAIAGGFLGTLVLLAIVFIVFWKCVKNRKYTYIRKPKEFTPVYNCSRKDEMKVEDDCFETSAVNKDNKRGVNNPNYSSPKKAKKVKLTLPDDMDSGVDRSSSSLSSGDSPGVYNYQELKQADDSCIEADGSLKDINEIKQMHLSTDSKNPLIDVRSTLSSMFQMRKTESQQNILLTSDQD